MTEPSIFRYPGGKSQPAIREWISSHCPPGTRTYREPFVGGGGVFFEMRRSPGIEEWWINDKHDGLIAVNLALRDRPDEFIAACRAIEPARDDDPLTDGGPRGGKPTNARLKAEFDRLKLNPNCDQALRYYLVNRTVHGSGRVNYDIESRLSFGNPQGWNIVATDRLQRAAEAMQGVVITSGDYCPLFEAEGDDVWIYADPPYFANGNRTRTSQLYQHNFTVDDHRTFAEAVKTCPHRTCVSYDDHEFIRELFSDCHIVEGSWKYCGSTDAEKRDGRELLILNYDPARTVVRAPEVQLIDRLTAAEADELARHEATIERALDKAREAFVEKGLALAAIRDSGRPSQRLYRKTHTTFKDYVKLRWGMTEARACQFINGASRYEYLRETLTMVKVLPANERQNRELLRLETDEHAAQVWTQVVESAPDPTMIPASQVRNVVNAAIDYQPPPPDVLKQLRSAWNRANQTERDTFLSEIGVL